MRQKCQRVDHQMGGLRAGSHAVRDSSNAPSDSWLLVYLRRVKLDCDDHDDLDGEAINAKKLHA